MTRARLGLLLAALLLAAGCGRPMTGAETGFARSLFGETLDPAPVRLVNGALVGQMTWLRDPRPRTSCRERVYPPPPPGKVTASTGGIALFHWLMVRRDLYRSDFMRGWPGRIDIADAMLLAHELTHVWQWQNRARTGYHPLRAAAEHAPGTDPYLFEQKARAAFLDYPYEQQGAIVEEYVCCRAIDPHGARTRRLHDLLLREFPVARLDAALAPKRIALPWPEADLAGICD